MKSIHFKLLLFVTLISASLTGRPLWANLVGTTCSTGVEFDGSDSESENSFTDDFQGRDEIGEMASGDGGGASLIAGSWFPKVFKVCRKVPVIGAAVTLLGGRDLKECIDTATEDREACYAGADSRKSICDRAARQLCGVARTHELNKCAATHASETGSCDTGYYSDIAACVLRFVDPGGEDISDLVQWITECF